VVAGEEATEGAQAIGAQVDVAAAQPEADRPPGVEEVDDRDAAAGPQVEARALQRLLERRDHGQRVGEGHRVDLALVIGVASVRPGVEVHDTGEALPLEARGGLSPHRGRGLDPHHSRAAGEEAGQAPPGAAAHVEHALTRPEGERPHRLPATEEGRVQS
jgi:hypothetical protein